MNRPSKSMWYAMGGGYSLLTLGFIAVAIYRSSLQALIFALVGVVIITLCVAFAKREE